VRVFIGGFSLDQASPIKQNLKLCRIKLFMTQLLKHEISALVQNTPRSSDENHDE